MKKTYLMIGGTLLPAFAAVGIVSLLTKSPISMKEAKYLLVFAAASCIGGFYSAKAVQSATW